MTAQELIAAAEQARRSGDEATALKHFSDAAEQARRAFEPAVEGKAMLGVGEMRLLLGDDLGARRAFDEAIGRAMEGGDAHVEAAAWFCLASSCFDAGLSKDGHDSLLESMALYREIADADPADIAAKTRLAQCIRLYGEHLGVLGSESDAKQALELARIMYLDLGETEIARSVEGDLERLRNWAR
jgi:tetratricopeptide (TPR) repeat protein